VAPTVLDAVPATHEVQLEDPGLAEYVPEGLKLQLVDPEEDV